jgi:hypothetical protein
VRPSHFLHRPGFWWRWFIDEPAGVVCRGAMVPAGKYADERAAFAGECTHCLPSFGGVCIKLPTRIANALTSECRLERRGRRYTATISAKQGARSAVAVCALPFGSRLCFGVLRRGGVHDRLAEAGIVRYERSRP